jgi:hypothetical protein
MLPPGERSSGESIMADRTTGFGIIVRKPADPQEAEAPCRDAARGSGIRPVPQLNLSEAAGSLAPYHQFENDGDHLDQASTSPRDAGSSLAAPNSLKSAKFTDTGVLASGLEVLPEPVKDTTENPSSPRIDRPGQR